MKKIALLTSTDLHGFISDEDILIEELKRSGLSVELVSWDADVDWSAFDAAIIRTTWDYTKRLPEFLSKLEIIGQQTRLFNPLEVVKWNSHKKYLIDLESKGVEIVPTVLFNHPERPLIPDAWKGSRFIIKPAVSAGAFKTMSLTRAEFESRSYESELFAGDWMLQPFLDEINQGEISLLYFGQQLSHSIIKVPKAGDFRVQEEFGGDIKLFEVDEKLRSLGQKIRNLIPEDLLFARVDLVRSGESYALMELELIEPSLFFRKDPSAANRFRESLLLHI